MLLKGLQLVSNSTTGKGPNSNYFVFKDSDKGLFIKEANFRYPDVLVCNWDNKKFPQNTWNLKLLYRIFI